VGGDNHAVQHVLLISVDGLHRADLDYYVASHPDSTLARLVDEGASYSNARTPFPSDSFPGLTALVTGGNPRSTGVTTTTAGTGPSSPRAPSTAKMRRPVRR